MKSGSHILSRRYLDPLDRASEVLFGLIMVLTFTGSLSAAEAGRAEVRAMLIAALGCNFAWGVIDAILFLMACWADEGRTIVAWRKVRAAAHPEEAHKVIADLLPSAVAGAMRPRELEALRQTLADAPEPEVRSRLAKEDYLGALGVFLWVFVVTFPVAIPFVFISDPHVALRVSNAIAVAMLFVAGYSLGRHAGRTPWKIGLWMVAVGIVLVGLTIALGG